MSFSHSLGFPRIGDQRQLKFALERYWRGEIDQSALQAEAKNRREATWEVENSLDYITAGDFSLYDHVLDTSVLLGVVPERFNHTFGEKVSLDTYFRIARGQAPTGEDTFASAMTKWFDTNYHYLVPEITKDQKFTLSSDKLFDEVKEAQAFSDKPVKAVLLGPITWLYLAEVKGEAFDRLTLLDDLVETYKTILSKLQSQGVEWVQIDEPILVLDLDNNWKDAFKHTYNQLRSIDIKLLLTTYFDGLYDNLVTIAQLPVAGLHVDGVLGDLAAVAKIWPADRVLSVGIVNGRNIWTNDLSQSLVTLKPLADKYGDNLWIASSCSLLHVPVDLSQEDRIDAELKSWLAFALDKISEITILTKALNLGESAVVKEIEASNNIQESRQKSTRIHNQAVVDRVTNIKAGDDQRSTPFSQRSALQAEKYQLPLFPTTTIGSFPQTNEIRTIRRDYRQNEIDENAYKAGIREHIQYAIDEQEKLGLDVLVHGEAERNDMVEYFGELLEGFAFTRFGWVQSYGSRCVKPPIIYGDVSRPQAMTVEWIEYANSLTKKEVKGMLTGPVTILSWSFPRDDESYENSAYQIALALRDEVTDLENAGVSIIQIDEPAIRELMPLRKDRQKSYLNWAEKAFRLSSSGVNDETQIHTHMCYSEFNEIIHSIANLDADVITIETSRSDMRLLDVFRDFKYPNDIGPGVYDIHSPRIPEVSEIKNLIERATEYLPKERIWVNPDCGLKTRKWDETRAALKNVVQATKELRAQYQA